MGLIGNQENGNKPTENIIPIKKEAKEKMGRKKIVPILIVLFALALLSGLIALGHWTFVHQDELKEKFFPSEQPTETVQIEETPKKEKTSFFRKLIKRNRTIVVKGTLLGEEGGAAVLINKKMLPAGTVINGIRILEITNDSIVVESGGLKRRLQVGETFDPDEK